MRYELYEDHADYLYRYIYQNDDLNKIVDFLIRLMKKRKCRYIIFDNVRGHALGKTQNLTPKEQEMITYYLKIEKHLSQNDQKNLEENFLAAYEKAEIKARQEMETFQRI